MSAMILRVSDAVKIHNPGGPGEVRALDGVSLCAAEGDFLVVIGKNGAGKSSLLDAVAGSAELDSGSVEIGGKDITGWTETRRAPLIGRVFQNPSAGTFPNMTAIENIAAAACRGRFRGLGAAVTRGLRAEAKDRLSALGMGLESRLDTPAGLLSGGEKQALSLIMASWLRPRLLLMDEPASALDPKSSEKIIGIINALAAGGSGAVIMVTHSMRHAADCGTRALVMSGGGITRELSGVEKQRSGAETLAGFLGESGRADGD